MSKLSRRNFVKLAGSTLAAATVSSFAGTAATPPEPAQSTGVAVDQKAYLPKAKGPRVVIVGGGTSGLTLAKYLKKENPKFDVVLVEKRAMYTSCFASNLWYPNIINLEFLAHSFLDAAKNGGYTFFNATCIGLDRDARKIATDQGDIDYDYLALAPGIDYDYAKIGVTNPEDEYGLRIHYPAGWTMGTEHVTIKHKIQNFKGGVFVQTVPGGNYRCKPAPYERACMIAAVFKQNKIKGKVLLLDNNPDIAVKKDGFHAAYDELYKGIVEYVPSVTITGVDVANKTINTEFDAYSFDDAAIYPNIRASKLIEKFGLVNPESPQKEANIDPLKYHLIGDEHVYVTGDCRPMAFPKSAHLANSEAKYVAQVIAAHVAGKELAWVSPKSVCYSMVSADPKEAISMRSGFTYDAEKKGFAPSKESGTDEERDAKKGGEALEWAQRIYSDLFSKTDG